MSDITEWLTKKSWTSTELAALCCGLNPSSVKDWNRATLDEVEKEIKKAATVGELIFLSHSNMGVLKFPIESSELRFRPQDAIAWARSKPTFVNFPFKSLLPNEVGYTSRKVSKAPPPVRPIRSSGSSGTIYSRPASKETKVQPKNDRAPNWKKWSNMPLLSIWEGVALSLNIDPDRVNRQVSMGGYDNATFRESKEFMDRMEIAVRHGCSDKLYMQTLPKDEDANVSQDEFWTWAKTVDWELPVEITSSKPDLNKWRQEDLWVESELMALCCGFNPDSSEDFFAKEEVKSKLAFAKERIQRAIAIDKLKHEYKHTATQLERAQNKCYLFRPSDAIAWAAPKFPDFPFPPENKSAEPVNSISDTPESDSAQGIDVELKIEKIVTDEFNSKKNMQENEIINVLESLDYIPKSMPIENMRGKNGARSKVWQEIELREKDRRNKLFTSKPHFQGVWKSMFANECLKRVSE